MIFVATKYRSAILVPIKAVVGNEDIGLDDSNKNTRFGYLQKKHNFETQYYYGMEDVLHTVK